MLLVYVVLHLVNHALGIVSLAAMERGLAWSLAPWRTAAGTVLLGGAALVHALTALWGLLMRRALHRLPLAQLAQAALGLLLPITLAGHVLGTRGLHEAFAAETGYAMELAYLWVISPGTGLLQAVLVIAVWLHACLGLHAWLRLRPGYVRTQGWWLACAVLLPALALAGYVSRGIEVRDRALTEPSYVAALAADARLPANGLAWVTRGANMIGGITLLGYGLLFGLRALGRVRRRDTLRLNYAGRRTLEIPRGASLLDSLRAAGIAHASVCGGRGRCSTCRVHVDAGGASLPPPTPDELRVLRRISAPDSVRLACQLRPTGDLAISPLLPSDAGVQSAWRHQELRRSEERTVCVLFADLRGFTRLAESRLPYDVVFVLNRFRVAMTTAITEAGGVVNEFVGDGLMALFGLAVAPAAACAQAIDASMRMQAALQALNESLAAELQTPLRIGIGIHMGPVIIGEMGPAAVAAITAVGDVVNTASRLEEMTKRFAVQVVVSEDVARAAGTLPAHARREEVEIRGRIEPLAIHVYDVLRAD